MAAKSAVLHRLDIRRSTASEPLCRGKCRCGSMRGSVKRVKKFSSKSHGSKEPRRMRGTSVSRNTEVTKAGRLLPQSAP